MKKAKSQGEKRAWITSSLTVAILVSSKRVSFADLVHLGDMNPQIQPLVLLLLPLLSLTCFGLRHGALATRN